MVPRNGGGGVAEIVAAHLVHIGLTALQQDDGEIARAPALEGGLGLLVGHLAHRLIQVALEVDHQQIGGRGLLHARQLVHHELADLLRQSHKIALAAEIGSQFLGEQAVLGEGAALAVQIPHGALRLARHVALRRLVPQIHLGLGKHVHTGHEIEHVQNRLINVHEEPSMRKETSGNQLETRGRNYQPGRNGDSL